MSEERLRGERDRSIRTASHLAMDVAERDNLIVEYKAEVERLRAKITEWEKVYAQCDQSRDEISDKMAAEIERLQNENNILRADDREARAEIERLQAALRDTRCPGGGYTGQPKDEEPTVGACLNAGVCGCETGAALEGG